MDDDIVVKDLYSCDGCHPEGVARHGGAAVGGIGHSPARGFEPRQR